MSGLVDSSTLSWQVVSTYSSAPTPSWRELTIFLHLLLLLVQRAHRLLLLTICIYFSFLDCTVMLFDKASFDKMLACASFCRARNHWIGNLIKLTRCMTILWSYLVCLVEALLGLLVMWTDNLLAQLFLTQCGVLLAAGLLLLQLLMLLLFILRLVLCDAFGRYLIQAVQVTVSIYVTWWHRAPRLLRAVK